MQEKYLTPSPSIEKQKEDICSNRSNSQSRFSISRVGREKQRYDGEKRLLACIVVTKIEVEQNQPQVLLISSSKYPNEWVLPKGGWENDEGILVCALREVEEEAGVSLHEYMLSIF
jgi:diphosphoinositol-polyphosphate diphosphatase